jgi:hypothetical protein
MTRSGKVTMLQNWAKGANQGTHYGGCISKGPLISRKEGRVD